MKLLSYGKDGGPDSTVWGFWLIEWKRLFSIALLVFEDGSRDMFHSHAFNSVSWVLKGELVEKTVGEQSGKCLGWIDGKWQTPFGSLFKYYYYDPSFKPIITKRDRFHQVTSKGRTWVLTFRGPWAKQWKEYDPKTGESFTLESGRKVVGKSYQE